LPRYAASRTLAAPVDAVWAVLAEPERFADWWPDVVQVTPTVRHALAPGALWQIEGTSRPSLLRRPQASGRLLVLEVDPLRRVAFQLLAERVDAELELEPVDEELTDATLAVEVPWLIGVGRSFPSKALSRLAGLVRRPEP
jgi:uncharacterized protein YndB with AHSA1/START domain